MIRQDDAPALALWERLVQAVGPRIGLVREVRMVPLRDPELPLVHMYAVGTCRTARFSEVEGPGFGHAVKQSAPLARIAAVCEALERYAAAVYRRRDLVIGSLDELGTAAIDPRSYPLASSAEYTAGRFPYPRFDPALKTAWVSGRTLPDEEDQLVPACFVFNPFKPVAVNELLAPLTSTGTAVAPTRRDALLAALLEIIERDALAIAWQNRLVMPSIDLRTIADRTVEELVRGYADAGVELTCKLLTTDVGVPVTLVIGIARRRAPLIAMATRADPDPIRAVIGALCELELMRTAIGARVDQSPPPNSVDSIGGLEDQYAFYCREDRLPLLDFLFSGPRADIPAPFAQTAEDGLARLIERMAELSIRAIGVDLTTPDLRALGMTAIRVIAPGMQPVSYQPHFNYRGGTRLYAAPVAMGLSDRPLAEGELNPWPMP